MSKIIDIDTKYAVTDGYYFYDAFGYQCGLNLSSINQICSGKEEAERVLSELSENYEGLKVVKIDFSAHIS